MHEIFVNLKRFDVPRALGGVCPADDSAAWIRGVMSQSIALGLGASQGLSVVYLLPEALIIPAQEALRALPGEARKNLRIGCQSVFRENIKPGGNFGAFTSNLPAASAYQLGCSWAMIGHSEERRDKQQIIGAFCPEWNDSESTRQGCAAAVDGLINREALCALQQGMDVLLCLGETAEERGDGSFEQQKPRIQKSLFSQLERGLAGVKAHLPAHRVVLGYEPVWAIGPGKAPPSAEYIAFVSTLIKDLAFELYGLELPVVYGGGLKSENAASIAAVSTIDGGLVALTRFSGEIGFYVEELKVIVENYIAGKEASKDEA